MKTRRTIEADDIALDLGSGMTDADLQAKYGLSDRLLQRFYRKLVRRKEVHHRDLYERSPLYRDAVDNMRLRVRPRADLNVTLPIFEMGSLAKGLVRDISDKGFRVAGIPCNPGEIKAFQLPLDTFVSSDPVLIVGRCRWAEKRGKTKQYTVAGFEIVDIREADLEVLRRFINFAVLSKSGEWQALR